MTILLTPNLVPLLHVSFSSIPKDRYEAIMFRCPVTLSSKQRGSWLGLSSVPLASIPENIMSVFYVDSVFSALGLQKKTFTRMLDWRFDKMYMRASHVC